MFLVIDGTGHWLNISNLKNKNNVKGRQRSDYNKKKLCAMKNILYLRKCICIQGNMFSFNKKYLCAVKNVSNIRKYICIQ